MKANIVFNFLKRVAFAILAFGVGAVLAAWDIDPQNPTFHWGDLREGNIVSDGLGGAFFCFGSYSFSPWQRVGHINADGDCTFEGTTPPWEGLLLADEPGFGSTLDGLTLIPSEPAGTVIACDRRYDQNGQFIGTAFFKFDTLGFTGFERVIVSDTSVRPYQGFEGQPGGTISAISDGQGGVHIGLISNQVNPTFFYYNHLWSDGTFTYDWPGLFVPAPVIEPDGFGGVFLLFFNHPAREIWGLRFDQEGIQQWSDPRFLIRDFASYAGSLNLLISPGRLMFNLDTLTAPNIYVHNLFLVDTAGNHHWESEGRIFAREYSRPLFYENSFVSDGTGGFINNRFYPPDSSLMFRFSEAGQLVASNLDDGQIYRIDGTGGGYRAYEVGWENSLYAAVWHWNGELTPAWNDSVIALDVSEAYWGGDYIAAEQNGVIGMVHTILGVVFYHVNPDGSVGSRVDARDHQPILPNHIEILSVYPNPFNNTLNILLDVPLHQDVTLLLYDLLGREVDVVYRGRLSSNTISYVAPAALTSGVYFLRAASAMERSELVKVVLLK